MEHPIYGLVGRGRVATHLARYLGLEHIPFRQWHRGMERDVADVLGNAKVILLAISDDALESFLAAHPELAERAVVHFSGSAVISLTTGLHPLTTFGPDPYDLDTYRAVPFVTERGGLAFSDVFPGLENPAWTVDPELKPLYHALCVMAGNFPTLLWAKAFDEFENRLGLPREVLRPYLFQALENTFAGGDKALTGPLARGDRGTAKRNLAALGSDDYAAVYRAFARHHGMQEL